MQLLCCSFFQFVKVFHCYLFAAATIKDLNNQSFKDPKVTCDEKILMSEAQIKEMMDVINAIRRREKSSDMRKLVSHLV